MNRQTESDEKYSSIFNCNTTLKKLFRSFSMQGATLMEIHPPFIRNQLGVVASDSAIPPY
jgi:hypothetical protein